MFVAVLSPDPEIQQFIAIVLRALAMVNISAIAIRPADLAASEETLDQMLRARISPENPQQRPNHSGVAVYESSAAHKQMLDSTELLHH